MADLAVGIGCARGTDPAALAGFVRDGLAVSGLSPADVAVVASHEMKSAEPALHALAAALGVPARFFGTAALLAETGRLANPSPVAFRETGCWGVAEGAALAAVGPAGSLVLPKRASARMTMAVARSSRPLDAAAIGRSS